MSRIIAPVPPSFTPRSRSSTCLIPHASTLAVVLSAHTTLLKSLAFVVLAPLLLPSLPLSPRLIQRIRIKQLNRLGFLRSVFALVRVGCLQLIFGLLSLDGIISHMLGWLRLFLSTTPLMSAFRLFRGSVLGFFSRSEIEFVIRLGVAVSSAPFLFPCSVSRDSSPPQVWRVEVTQPKRTRELPQLVQTKGLGEDAGSLPIRRNVLKFDFTRKDTFTNKMVVHLNVLSPCVENEVLRELDAAEVVAVDRHWIRHLLLQILK